jgi:lysyl-tRNA synthetase class 2
MNASLKKDRLKKLKNIIEAGIDPYPSLAFPKESAKSLLEKPNGTPARAAGRIMLFREMGRIAFLHLQDESGRIQFVLNENELGRELFRFWIKNLDLGDFVGLEGERFDTKKGERSLLVKKLTLLSKSLLPLPDKHKALKNEEQRLRKRYLDILFNPEIKEMIYRKEKFWQTVRSFMKSHDFLEVETPILEAVPGGGDANPFITKHQALAMDLYLRISTGELWQKRLLVAGLEKTFEIGRQFRNEGMDAEHLQDYTQMEFYWAYADYQTGMALVKELFTKIAQEVYGTLKFTIKDFQIDLSGDWKVYNYKETIEEKTGINVLTVDLPTVQKKLDELGVKYQAKNLNLSRAIDNLWKFCRKSIAGPGFLINEPVAVSPLAKKTKNNPLLTERFHVILAGSELGNGYSELNDPQDQKERFLIQQGLRDNGDQEAQMTDTHFLEALEYGMPPACGFGMSERLFSFLENKTMRECQIFPLVKPKL